MSSSAELEIKSRSRFAFGKNWSSLREGIDRRSIEGATLDLQNYIPLSNSAKSQTFLDIGSGSGLTSAAANSMGYKVTSFDFDSECVEITRSIRIEFGEPDPTVFTGDILDKNFVIDLGQFDVVCSWGVLHHTGNLKQALENTKELVAKDGLLFIAIYNEQGFPTRYWKFIKKQYVSHGIFTKLILLNLHRAFFFFRDFALGLFFSVLNKRIAILKKFIERNRERGMTRKNDLIDWVGGYPFEAAKPEQILEAIGSKFQLIKLQTSGAGHGCNIFLFKKIFQ